jgi:hypothetical protein
LGFGPFTKKNVIGGNMKRSLEFEFIEGDVIAQNGHENLLITEKGLMIANKDGDEHFLSWNLFLKYYSHLKTLEKACGVITSVVGKYER